MKKRVQETTAEKRPTWRRRALAAAALGALLVGAWVAYSGGALQPAGEVTAQPVLTEAVRARAQRQVAAREALGAPSTDLRILFGDLHVHTTFSADAFLRSLPLMNGEGAHPPADACDFARFCSDLDFFALTDHAETLAPHHWEETKRSIRECNAVASDPADPDLVAFTGYEWSQVGLTPDAHFGHKNVIFRDTAEANLPPRPISSKGAGNALRSSPVAATWVLPLIPLLEWSQRSQYLDLVAFLLANRELPICPAGVDSRDLPADCREIAETPDLLFEKLDQWGHEALVIPHGTTWGFYTPPGSTWDKQLEPGSDDPDRQRLFEVFSGHGNSEQWRPWRAVTFSEDGEPTCPAPSEGFEPCCHRAGEIIRARCENPRSEACEARVATARQNYLRAGVAGHLSVPGAAVEDWKDCGQCRDCYAPSFQYRPGGSAQYVLARGHFGANGEPVKHARMGFIASSDNHSARPGTGYKEYARRKMTETSGARDETWAERIFGARPEPARDSIRWEAEDLLARPPFSLVHVERQASFFMTGGLVAVHAAGRDRGAIWDALVQRRAYGTSGDRILLWFDAVLETGEKHPMGSSVVSAVAPTLRVRAVGAFEQEPGCPASSEAALGARRLARLCAGECYRPSERRKIVERLEVVRIRPQQRPDEPISELIDDPWRVFACPPSESGCAAEFTDPEFAAGDREVVYYARAIQAPSPAVNAGGLRCEGDACRPCYGDYRSDPDDDCLAPTAERAWSSPIRVRPR